MITESVFSNVFSKISGLNMEDETFMDKLKYPKIFRNENDDIGFMIINAIKQGKETDVHFKSRNYESDVEFKISKVPIKIEKRFLPTFREHYYNIFIPILSNDLRISSKLGKKIVGLLYKKHVK